MPSPAIIVGVGADTSQAFRDIEGLRTRLRPFNLQFNADTRPLGRITGQLSEFNKSLDAATARVLAFSASVGAFYTAQKTIESFVKSTIDVEKSLADINISLNLSGRNLSEFGNKLFDVAKNSGKTFKEVATAAAELSRQGLGVEETLRRTSDAMILARRSGLSVEDSINAITAALNSFNDSALDSNVLINKVIAVDTNFAVSSKDLAEAIRRVGSTAVDAGVGIDQLLGAITAVQQTTSRGGAVIGNAFKTIFSNLESKNVIENLQLLGVNIDETGNGLEKLSAIAERIKGVNIIDAQQIKQLVAGKFQINVLNALLDDLAKKYSISADAANKSKNATNEANIANEKLNQTLSARINKLFVTGTQAGEVIGRNTLSPILNVGIDSAQKLLSGIVEGDKGETAGGMVAKTFAKGFADFLAGPGITAIGFVFFKLIGTLVRDSIEAIKALTGINEQRLQIESLIRNELASEPALLDAIINRGEGELALRERILQRLQAQVALMEASTRLAGPISTVISEAGLAYTSKKGFVQKTPIFADFSKISPSNIPNFSSSISNAIVREISSGVSLSQIKIGSHPSLVSANNISGLGIYNTRDEPGGISQGIHRAIRENRNPRNYNVPNFADKLLFPNTIPKVIEPPSQTPSFIMERFGGLTQFNKEVAESARELKVLRNIEAERALAERKDLEVYEKSIAIRSELFGQTKNDLQRFAQKSIISPSLPISPNSGMLGLITPNSNVYQNTQNISTESRQIIANAAMLGLLKDPNNLSKLTSPYYGKNAFAPSEMARNISSIAQSLPNSRIKVEVPEGYIMPGRGTAPTTNRMGISEFLRQPRVQNLALAGSIFPYFLSSAVSGGVDQNTRKGRLISAGITGAADVLGFSSLGLATGNLPLAATGASIGLISGVSRFLKEFNDELPELNKNLQLASESVSTLTDSYSNLIQITDLFKRARGGEISLTGVQQRAALFKLRSSTIGLPNQSEILSAAFGGDTEAMEKLLSPIIEREKRQQSLASIAIGFSKFGKGETTDLRGILSLLGSVTSPTGKTINDIINLPENKNLQLEGKKSRLLTTQEILGFRITDRQLENIRNINPNIESLPRDIRFLKEAVPTSTVSDFSGMNRILNQIDPSGDLSQSFSKLSDKNKSQIISSVRAGDITPLADLQKALGQKFFDVSVQSQLFRQGLHARLTEPSLQSILNIGAISRTNKLTSTREQIQLEKLSGVISPFSVLDIRRQNELGENSRAMELLRLQTRGGTTSNIMNILKGVDISGLPLDKQQSVMNLIDTIRGLRLGGQLNTNEVGNIQTSLLTKENQSTNKILSSSLVQIKDELELEGVHLREINDSYKNEQQIINKTIDALKSNLTKVQGIGDALAQLDQENRNITNRISFLSHPEFVKKSIKKGIGLREEEIAGVDIERGILSGGKNLFFSDDFANQSRQTRQKEILNNQNFSGIGGAADSFVEVMQYSKNTLKRDLSEAGGELGLSLKSSFAEGWKEFARGEKTAVDALKGFALSFATAIQGKIIDIGTNALFGILFNSIGGSLGASLSGKKFSSGGLVVGGSGVRDDVPAVLSGGDYVIKKESVQSIGQDRLKMLNSGVDLTLNNKFDYLGGSRPYGGVFNTSPFLSAFGQTDENNPQNTLKFEREQGLYQYLSEKAQYEEQKRQALANFKKQKHQQFIGSLISTVVSVGGAYAAGKISTRTPGKFGQGQLDITSPYNYNFGRVATGGAISGGDNVPVMLTGGEFVVNKNIVSKYGTAYFDQLNKGRIPGFDSGGLVGNSVIPGSSSSNMDKLIEAIQSLQFTFENKGSNQIGFSNGSSSNITVNNNITINKSTGEITSDSKVEDNRKDKDKKSDTQDVETAKRLGVMMENVARQVIITEKKNGGLLQNAR